MILFYLIPIIALLIAGVCSYFIARKLYRQLVSKHIKWPKVIATATFVLSFLLMTYVIIYLIAINASFNR
jgi:hypothetical protein